MKKRQTGDGGMAAGASIPQKIRSLRRGIRLLILAAAGLAIISSTAKANWLTDKLADFFSSPAAPPAPQAGAIPAHMKGAPLPSGPNAPTDKDFSKIYSAWFNRAIMSHYPAAKDPTGAAFVRAALAYVAANLPLDPPPDLIAQERSFDLKSLTDPALLTMIGVIEPPTQRRMTALEDALPLLAGSPYPRFIWFLAAANTGKAAHDFNAGSDELATRDRLSLDYLQQALADDSFQPGEMAALRWRFDSGSCKDLFKRNPDKVADIFQASPKIDPWVREYVQGVRFQEDAWNARGRGWSNSVSQQGWQGFAENLALSRSHLTRSWQLNPRDPGAASAMIAVCMGGNEETDTMRTWFDRSVAADFDYMPAYTAMRWGLRPRWLGSFSEMAIFARECAATGRYDTPVPGVLVAIAFDMSEDSENDPTAPFQPGALGTDLLTVLDNYLKQPGAPILPAYAHTLAAIVAHKAGNMQEVKSHMAAIDYKPLLWRSLRNLDDLPALATQAQAMPGQ